MREDEVRLDDLVFTELLRLNALVTGIIIGLVAAFGIFIATNWLVIRGGDVVGPHLGLLSQFFFGYQVTFVGSLIGSAYGLIVGFAVGYFVATTYNWVVDFRENHRRKQSAGKAN